MTCKVQRDFKIITDELSRVSRQFPWWHRTLGDLRFVPQNLCIKNKSGDFGRVEGSFQNRCVKRFRGPDSSYPVCYDRRVSIELLNKLLPTQPSPPRGREKKNVTKVNFSSCNDHSPKWIVNNCYIFFLCLRVWVFLFLWTSFFKAQHIGPMLQ